MDKLRSGVSKILIVNLIKNEDKKESVLPRRSTLAKIPNISLESVRKSKGASISQSFTEQPADIKRFNKVLENCRSDIPSGLDTFHLLQLIKSKDTSFTLPLPETMILNCGFENSTLIKSGYRLAFLPKDSREEVLRSMAEFARQYPFRNQSIPMFIIKYRKLKRLEFNVKDLIDQFPDLDSECIIQEFIPPRGLKAIKYRVIVNDFRKVIIYSNKHRIDGKDDDYGRREVRGRAMSAYNIEKTLVNHKDVLKYINSNSSCGKLAGNSIGTKAKTLVYNLFRNQLKTDNNNKHKVTSEFNALTRLLTHEDIEKTSLFDGKNQSFASIISMTEYLRQKIDYYFLDDAKLTELAVDYIQDPSGIWYLLKIKYGKTQKKAKLVIPMSTSLKKLKKKKRIMLKSMKQLFHKSRNDSIG